MISCPTCGDVESKVIDSRSMSDGVRRRRECIKCGVRFTTYERIQSKSIFIIKKDSRREEYNREKLLTGVRKACQKRPLPMGAIDKLVDGIESELYQSGKNEISSSIVGDKVMQRLEDLDYIAYIRFASVYRDFTDISDLKQAVDNIVDSKAKSPPVEQLFLLKPDQITNKNDKNTGRRMGR